LPKEPARVVEGSFYFAFIVSKIYYSTCHFLLNILNIRFMKGELIQKVLYLTLALPLIIVLLPNLSFGGESTLKPHNPIFINSEKGFTKPDAGRGCECVTGGSGTSTDPYIIENWDIESPERYGIYVYGTDAHFVIRGVKVNGIKDPRYSGIYLEDIQNARIQGTTVTNNKGSGILLHDSSNNELSGNTLRDNANVGIGLFRWSKNNVLEGNIVTANSWGIQLEVSNGNFLSSNTVTGNKLGMFLRGFGNLYVGNTIKENSDGGINFDTSKNSVFISNVVCDNKSAGIAFYSSEGVVLDGNTICDNQRGVLLESSTGNLIINNKIIGTEGDAILVDERFQKENRFINNTVEDKTKDSASGEGKKEDSSGSPSSGEAK
jgi:parallel beta-helix repeat protein